MTQPLDRNTERLIKELVDNVREHGLVLFVGAGINGKALPLWGRLLNQLLDQAIQGTYLEDPRVSSLAPHLLEWASAHFDTCSQASILKKLLGNERYRLEIQDALYREAPDVENEVITYCEARRGPNTPPPGKYELLWRIAKLCSTEHVRAVATFNFDTLLECAINACHEKCARAYFGEVASEGQPWDSSKPVIPVFHLHGMLSPPNTILRNRAESVVFSYDEYFDKNADPLSWETATPLHILRNFCTLWVGASLRDWNMLRLLDGAKSGRKSVNSYCLQTFEEINWTLALPRPGSHSQDEATYQRDCSDLPVQYQRIQKVSAEFRQIAMRFQATLFDAVGTQLIVPCDTFAELPDSFSRLVYEPIAAIRAAPPHMPNPD